MRPDRTFQRTVIIVGVLHVIVIAAVYVFSSLRGKATPPQVIWLVDGSIGGGEEPGEVATASRPAEPEPAPEPPPIESKPELVPPPPVPSAPSELVTHKTTPEPSTPKPSTPKPETPKPATPKLATPKPTPKATPKPKPTTPKATPKADTTSPKPKASPSETPKGTPGSAKSDGATASAGSTSVGSKGTGPAGGNGPGVGNGKGPAKTGSGSGTSEFGWYFSMIHDRFHNRWEQPTSIVRAAQEFVTTVKIRIAKDGTILSREIVKTSGDTLMDESVMAAAAKVQQIDPLPAGLGSGDVFEVNVAFKLDQGL